MRLTARCKIILLGYLCSYAVFVHAQNEKPLIVEQDLQKARELFGGPSEEDFYRTDQMLVSATGSAKPVFLAPSVASVISKEDIEAMGATTLDEVLQTVPGLHVAPSPSVGPLLTNFSMRGILTGFNPQILLSINGVPIKKLWNGGKDYRFVLPVSMISRVEIVRGPGSAVHGADAFSGTINVVTKDGQEVNGFQSGVRRGSFQTTDAWLQYGGNISRWDVVASVEYLKNGTDSNRVIDSDLQTTLDGVFGTSASLAPGQLNLDRELLHYNFGLQKDRWTMHFTGLRMRDAELGVGAAPVLDPASRHGSDRYLFDVGYHNAEIRSDWVMDVRANYSYLDDDNNYVVFPPGAVLPIGSDGNINFASPAGITLFTNGYIGNPDEINRVLGLEAVAFYNGAAQHSLRFAVGYGHSEFEARESKNFGPGVIDGTQAVVDGTLTDVSGTANVYGPNTIRTMNYFSAQDEWTLSRQWELTAGARYDHYSDFGKTINPRLGLVWQTRFDLSTKFLYGRAFRAPSVSELYSQNNPVILGNKNLDPETIDTYELAFDYRPVVDVRLAANLFSYSIDGLIEAVPDVAGTTSTYQNFRDQKGHGAEVEVDWKLNEKLRLKGNVAWQKAEDKATGKPVPDTPQLQSYANANWRFSPLWSLDAQWFWVGDRKRAAGDTRPDIADYDMVNLTLRRKAIADHVDFAIALRNVFDANIREPSTSSIRNDYPMDGRATWLEVRGHL